MKELSLEQRFIKRGMDVIISVIALIVTSPLWLVCAVCIKMTDGGSVFLNRNGPLKMVRFLRFTNFGQCVKM